MVDINNRELIAALVTRTNPDSLDEALWLMCAGLGSVEDQWEVFSESFEELFGISWEEAEELATRYFANY